MSTYRLKVRFQDAEVEVVAKNGAVFAHELDRYLENFLKTSVKSSYSAPAPKFEERTSEEKATSGFNFEQQKPEVKAEPEFVQPMEDKKPEPPKAANDVLLSLSDFLSGTKAAQLFDEFIASAYYIKHILEQPDFTLKSLNAKFYPATNSLVDFGVVDDAKNRGLIEIFEQDGTTKYTLNSAGENYFREQLQ